MCVKFLSFCLLVPIQPYDTVETLRKRQSTVPEQITVITKADLLSCSI